MYVGCFHICLLSVMAIICLCIPLYVLIGAGHQGINLLIVSVCELVFCERTGSVSP